MLPFNVEFQTNQSKITQIRLSVLLQSGTLLNMTEEHVMLGGFARDTSTTVDGEFTIGGAVTGKLTVTIDNSSDTFSGYDFRGARITASLGGQLSDESYQLVQVGIYTVDEYTYDGCNITLTAYDNFFKFDTPCKDSSITFPKTITQLLEEACYSTRTLYPNAYVELANATIPNGSFTVTQQPKQWDTMTWHDVVAYCAQIAGCYAKILPNGKLYLAWYNTEFFNDIQLDGGTFGTQTTPYADGAIADGGDFTYTDTTTYDGGTFGDRDGVHFINHIFGITVDTDDVLITGVSVVLSALDNIYATEGTQDYTKTLGTTGYVIRIENNPLIETVSGADSVCSYIYNIIVGMRFRPLQVSCLENPSLEAGDVALVIDRNDNTYYCFLSHVTYTTGASSSVSCDASSAMQNLKARYSEAQKTRALAERVFDTSVTSAEQAMSTILTAIATTMGLYQYTEDDGHGGTIYVYGNKSTLAASDIRWKFSAGAVMVSSDYGEHWNGAITADGQAVLQEIYAVKVNADNIQAGTLSFNRCSGGALRLGGANNGNGLLEIYDSSNVKNGTWNNTQLVLGTNENVVLRNTGEIRAKTPIWAAGGVWAVDTTYTSGTTDKRYANFRYDFISFIDNRDTTASYNNRGQLWIMATPRDYYGGPVSCMDIYASRGNLSLRIANGIDCQATIVVAQGYTKPKAINTSNYGQRLLYCYETPTPYFGDIGFGQIDQAGECIVSIDDILREGIAQIEYSVFLQKEGQGDLWVEEKDDSYFIVKGTPGLKFSWELKAAQRYFENYRLDDRYMEPMVRVEDDPDCGLPDLDEYLRSLDDFDDDFLSLTQELDQLDAEYAF